MPRSFGGEWPLDIRTKSTLVQVDPGWDFEPVVPELKQLGWTVATLKALKEAGELNRKAVRWTVAAVILGAASGLFALFDSN